MELRRYLATHRLKGSLYNAKRLVCADGFSVSVQASEFHYCNPRRNEGPHSSFELGYPSAHPGDDVMAYVEDAETPLDTVYAYVPYGVVMAMLNSHGGIVGPASE